MPTEVVDGWAVKQLRELYRLNRQQAASLCGLSYAQLTQLEEGGHDSFGSAANKIQAAMRFAATLSGKQANGCRVPMCFMWATARCWATVIPLVQM